MVSLVFCCRSQGEMTKLIQELKDMIDNKQKPKTSAAKGTTGVCGHGCTPATLPLNYDIMRPQKYSPVYFPASHEFASRVPFFAELFTYN